MVVGSLCKRIGVQPGGAKHKVLKLLVENETIDGKTLDKLSPYDSPVFSREARELVHLGLAKKTLETNTLRSMFAITDLGREVLADANAYEPEFVGRRIKTSYDKAFAKVRRYTVDGGNPFWAVNTILVIFSDEANWIILKDPRAQHIREEFYEKLRGVTSRIELMISEKLEQIGFDEQDDKGLATQLSRYHEGLKLRGINSYFDKSLLDRIMIERLRS